MLRKPFTPSLPPLEGIHFLPDLLAGGKESGIRPLKSRKNKGKK